MAIILETPRLIMKQFCEEDAKHLLELNSDPDIVKYVGEEVYHTLEDARPALLRNYAQYENYKMGRLSIFLKETGEFMGWGGLRYMTDEGYVDLGYRLMKRYWGKGYATESAIASLDYGFKTLGLGEIVATAMKENIASISVFKKLGMHYSHDQDCGCQPGVLYKITKDEWK